MNVLLLLLNLLPCSFQNFYRLSGFPNAKKDATSQAMRVIQPAIKLLNEDSSAVVLVGIAKILNIDLLNC